MKTGSQKAAGACRSCIELYHYGLKSPADDATYAFHVLKIEQVLNILVMLSCRGGVKMTCMGLAAQLYSCDCWPVKLGAHCRRVNTTANRAYLEGRLARLPVVCRALLTALPFAFGLTTAVAGAVALTVTLLAPLLATGATLVVSLKAVEASML